MATSTEFLELVTELMAGVGAVKARRMFGGAGIFFGPHMIGLVADDLLYLRSDGEDAFEFQERGLKPFIYSKGGKPVTMSYYLAPEECLDDPEVMTLWAGKAYQAALRAPRAASGKSKANGRDRS